MTWWKIIACTQCPLEVFIITTFQLNGLLCNKSMIWISYQMQGFSYHKNHYAKVIMISWWNKRFSANNLILLTSAFGLGHKILLPQFTTFTGNNDLFLSALRASRNKRIIFCFKSFISSLYHYDLRIIIIISAPLL